mgnify:CR=1 FL=1
MDLDPDSLNVSIHLSFNRRVERVETIGDEELVFGELIDRVSAIGLLGDFGGLVCDERAIVVDREEEVDSNPV